MREGVETEVLSKRDGPNDSVLVKTTKGEFWMPPELLEHIRTLERMLDSRETAVRECHAEIRRLWQVNKLIESTKASSNGHTD